MPNVIQQLHMDHVNIARLLDLMETELDNVASEKEPDYLMLEHALRYMTSYPDCVHHPIEDAVFDVLAEKLPEVQSLVIEVSREHRLLAQKSAQFYDTLKAVESEVVVSRTKFVAMGKDYIAMLRAHMSKEERGLLKRAEHSLNSEELEKIKLRVESTRDPLFSEARETEYQELYQYVLNQQSLN